MMPDEERVLSQQEVDALLRAINAGEVPLGGGGLPPSSATVLDFRRPLRLSRRELRAMDMIHEPLARGLRDIFSPILRAPVEVQPAGAGQVTFVEFTDSVPNPSTLTVASVEPGGGSLLLELSPVLAYPVVERLLGASGSLGDPLTRPLREIEWKILDRVLERILDRVAECWAGVMVARLKARAHETDPQAARAHMSEEALVRIGFVVEGDGRRGSVTLAIPSSLAERLVERRAAPPGLVGGSRAEGAILRAEVPLSVRLPIEAIALSDLEALAPGDVLVTSQGTQGTAVLEVGGVAKLSGRAGALRGRRALLVEDWLEPGRAARLGTPGPQPVRRRRGRRESRSKPDWRRVLSAAVEVRAVVAARAMPLREVLDLRPGAVVGLPSRPESRIVLEVGGRPFAAGVAVRVGERLGVQVESVQEPQKTARALA